MAGMALRPPAVEAVRASELPSALKEQIIESKAYAEGTPARIEVKTAKQVAWVKKLLSFKLTG